MTASVGIALIVLTSINWRTSAAKDCALAGKLDPQIDNPQKSLADLDKRRYDSALKFKFGITYPKGAEPKISIDKWTTFSYPRWGMRTIVTADLFPWRFWLESCRNYRLTQIEASGHFSEHSTRRDLHRFGCSKFEQSSVKKNCIKKPTYMAKSSLNQQGDYITCSLLHEKRPRPVMTLLLLSGRAQWKTSAGYHSASYKLRNKPTYKTPPTNFFPVGSSDVTVTIYPLYFQYVHPESFTHPCDLWIRSCMSAYDTGWLCARALHGAKFAFSNYCAMQYANCNLKADVWQLAYFGDCGIEKVPDNGEDFDIEGDNFLEAALINEPPFDPMTGQQQGTHS